jgi:hypothetical protein
MIFGIVLSALSDLRRCRARAVFGGRYERAADYTRPSCASCAFASFRRSGTIISFACER